MTNTELEKLYVDHREEVLSLATRKWGYSHDHAEDALQRACVYLLESWKKATPPGRTAFIQNVRQQCVNLMGKNEGRSVSRGTSAKVVPVGGQAELEIAEKVALERERGGRAYTGVRSAQREGAGEGRS